MPGMRYLSRRRQSVYLRRSEVATHVRSMRSSRRFRGPCGGAGAAGGPQGAGSVTGGIVRACVSLRRITIRCWISSVRRHRLCPAHVKSTYDFRLPDNWLAWDPTLPHGEPEADGAATVLGAQALFGAACSMSGATATSSDSRRWFRHGKAAGQDSAEHGRYLVRTNMESTITQAFRSLVWSAEQDGVQSHVTACARNMPVPSGD